MNVALRYKAEVQKIKELVEPHTMLGVHTFPNTLKSLWNLSPYEVSMIEQQICYAAPIFLGSGETAWSENTIEMRLAKITKAGVGWMRRAKATYRFGKTPETASLVRTLRSQQVLMGFTHGILSKSSPQILIEALDSDKYLM